MGVADMTWGPWGACPPAPLEVLGGSGCLCMGRGCWQQQGRGDIKEDSVMWGQGKVSCCLEATTVFGATHWKNCNHLLQHADLLEGGKGDMSE